MFSETKMSSCFLGEHMGPTTRSNGPNCHTPLSPHPFPGVTCSFFPHDSDTLALESVLAFDLLCPMEYDTGSRPPDTTYPTFPTCWFRTPSNHQQNNPGLGCCWMGHAAATLQRQSHLADSCVIAGAGGSPAKTRKANQLSSAQISDSQNPKPNMWFFKPLSLGR